MTPSTIYYVASSLDGFIADEHHGLSWLLQLDDPATRAHYEAFIGGVGALAMGSKTYDFVCRESPSAWPYTGLETWVFTHRDLPRPYPGAAIHFTADDVGAVHARMIEAARARGRSNLWLVGGGDLVAQFAARGLVDELHLAIAPVFLGRGIPLLPMALPASLTLVSTAPLGATFVDARYRWPHATNRSGAPLAT
ncbi:MAG: dihydrofolate reductase [Deltaproteobacteria bacterium]|nr:dihydrofolate reductase [Deltaproteobacteria bacterium]